jgi:hypothetical protein
MAAMAAIGTKRTCHFALHMSAFDPKRTSTTDDDLGAPVGTHRVRFIRRL